MEDLVCMTELKKPAKDARARHQTTISYMPRTVVRETEVPFHIGYTEKPLTTGINFAGSQYTGSANALGFAGKGTYRYAHGVIYEGEFRDGQFHGEGTLIYPQGQRLEGKWFKGKLVTHVYKNRESGSAEFVPGQHLTFPNRLAKKEIDENDRVVVSENQLAQPQHAIPKDCYDTGDGYFVPWEQINYAYTGEKRHFPSVEEQKLIETKFRQNADNNIGFMPELYEYWTSGRTAEIETIKRLEETRDSDGTALDTVNQNSTEVIYV